MVKTHKEREQLGDAALDHEVRLTCTLRFLPQEESDCCAVGKRECDSGSQGGKEKCARCQSQPECLTFISIQETASLPPAV